MDLATSSETGVDLSGRRLIGALFPDREHADQAIRDLREHGFEDSDLGLVVRRPETEMPADQSDAPAEDAAKGAIGGGVIGGLVGAGLALTVPGIGPLLAAGVFAAAATGVGIGAVGGGLIGLLTGMGYEESEAHRLQDGLDQGRVVVSVNALNRTQEAREILARDGGELGPVALDDAIQLDTGNRIELI